ncbi:type B DNA-directed DNA polymerase [Halorarum salinum]|uniref:DNA-directed DNA polymerase n=1 Tax=Halorarum salinum TaxID=2743089 RepID=A0A7D5QAH7_9EURY|nr:type B DNA-directed DNA polymerase [Halobaculum salinum]QLG60341.1 type B DNA-directed DNA polymerase [Halobaculum salinum]
MLTVDYLEEGGVREWRLTEDSVRTVANPEYRPTLYLGNPVSDLYGRSGGPNPSVTTGQETPREDLVELGEWLAPQEAVASVDIEHWRQSWRTPECPLLRVDVHLIDAVQSVAQRAQQYGHPDGVTCYNVDLSRQFRYALETGTEAAPDTSFRELRTLELGFPVYEAARGIDALPQLRVDGERVGRGPRAVVEHVQAIVDEADPDVFVMDTAEVVPLLYEAAETYGLDEFDLGRRPGWDILAGSSTYQTYGRISHSPARYHLPGRVIIDRSNTFFYSQGGMPGCLDLVKRAGLPLQELSWASIGRCLTAMQIREARSRGVLVPWRPWRPEFTKSMATLDDADRGGATLAPEVGVHELDFASMYPNIIRRYNVSPETVRCGCCDEDDARDVVPRLGYTICKEKGYLGDILGPLIDDRDAMKVAMKTTDNPEEQARLEQRSSAIKWILVSCFGYQGHANAKYGRIECHETINAYAREILLDAKAALEEGGWRVLHGIVDSIWVTPAADVDNEDRRPLKAITDEVSREAQIELEYEAAFDWVAFCPLRESNAGALTKYFGRRRDEDLPATPAVDLGEAVKLRGIECRQHDTPPFVAQVQRDLIAAFDRSRDVDAVLGVLERWLTKLAEEDVPVEQLEVQQRVSKDVEQYSQETLTVCALRRIKRQGTPLAPGQQVEYVVVDADGRGTERVRLAHEQVDHYDAEWYREQCIRAAVSVLSASGFRESDIKSYLTESETPSIQAY